LVTSHPLEDMPDDVDEDEEWDLTIYIDGAEEKGAFFSEERGLFDDKAKLILNYAAIDPYENFKCGIKTDEVDLVSPAAAKNTDDSCCV